MGKRHACRHRWCGTRVDKPLCLANVAGFVMLLHGLCLIPVLVWLVLDALGPERIEPSTPWIACVSFALLVLTVAGEWLCSFSVPDKRVLQLASILRREFEIRKSLRGRQVVGLLMIVCGAVALGLLVPLGFWIAFFWFPLFLMFVGVLLAIGPVIRPPGAQDGVIDRTTRLRPAPRHGARHHRRGVMKY